MGSEQKLRCELREPDRGSVNYSIHNPRHLHFLLFSDADGLKVYEEWNSWGYYARSFVATDAESKIYEISRRKAIWTVNFPSTDTLNKGEFVITNIYLCDGSWRISPKLPAGQPAELRIVGRFKSQEDKDAVSAGVWTGQIESKPVEVFLEKECVDRLNAERDKAPA